MMNCVKLRERDVISSLRSGCEPRSVIALKGFDVIICSSLLLVTPGRLYKPMDDLLELFNAARLCISL